MMIDLQQVQNGISRISDFDVRLISRPPCVLYSTVAPIMKPKNVNNSYCGFVVVAGNWMTYTFDENSTGVAARLEPEATTDPVWTKSNSSGKPDW